MNSLTLGFEDWRCGFVAFLDYVNAGVVFFDDDGCWVGWFDWTGLDLS